MPCAPPVLPFFSLKIWCCSWIARRSWAMFRCPSKRQSQLETDIGQACLAHIPKREHHEEASFHWSADGLRAGTERTSSPGLGQRQVQRRLELARAKRE